MREKYFVNFCVILFFIFIFSNSVYAVGLSHKDTIIHFKPNLKTSIAFNVINIQEGTTLDLSLDGELKKYATLSTVGSGGRVSVNFEFPAQIEKPGTHRVYLHAKEIPIETDGDIIRSVTAVRSPVIIKVPYPGKYLEINLDISRAKVNEDIIFTINTENLGVENIENAQASVMIYDSKEKLVGEFSSGGKAILSTQIKEFIITGEVKKEGTYNAVAIVNYDGQVAKVEKSFLVGALYIEIGDITEKFQQNTVNPFEIEITSKWNDGVSNVYANILITDKDNLEVASIKTPGVDIEPFGEETLNSFWDTGNLSLGNYKASVTLHYGGETTEKIAKVKIVDKLKDGLIPPFAIGYALCAGFIIFAYTFIRKRRLRRKYILERD